MSVISYFVFIVFSPLIEIFFGTSHNNTQFLLRKPFTIPNKNNASKPGNTNNSGYAARLDTASMSSCRNMASMSENFWVRLNFSVALLGRACNSSILAHRSGW